MEADFSTFELQYQTAVIRNARFCQDASLEPWDNEPEELLPTTVAELQRIAAFSPHGGLSYESAWEYLFLYNTYYVLMQRDYHFRSLAIDCMSVADLLSAISSLRL